MRTTSDNFEKTVFFTYPCTFDKCKASSEYYVAMHFLSYLHNERAIRSTFWAVVPSPLPSSPAAISVDTESKIAQLPSWDFKLFPCDQLFHAYRKSDSFQSFWKTLSFKWLEFSKWMWMSCYLRNSESWLWTETQNIHWQQNLSY